VAAYQLDALEMNFLDSKSHINSEWGEASLLIGLQYHGNKDHKMRVWQLDSKESYRDSENMAKKPQKAKNMSKSDLAQLKELMEGHAMSISDAMWASVG
jgi:hypothetical protein